MVLKRKSVIKTKYKNSKRLSSTTNSSIQTNIYYLIKKHLPVKSEEKSIRGEVFTPISMIENLYENFPNEIWRNPKKKWLDPSSGIGNFPIVLFFHLMKTLRKVIPNNKKRAKHIIENMIYMAEINKKNVNICKRIFHSICPSGIPNIFADDFMKLKSSLKKIGWPETFDVVIGNPPYNMGGTKTSGQKRTHILFTEEGLELLNRNGIIAYICPPSYRETNTQMNSIFQNNNGHFIYIKIYGSKETNQLFNVQARVDAFIYQKNSKGHTLIKDEYDYEYNIPKLDLKRHIPNFGFSIFDKLYQKVLKYGNLEAKKDHKMTTLKSKTFGNGRNKILHLITSKGRRIYKAKLKHTYSNIPKLFINALGVPYVFYDKKGEYGQTQSQIVVLKPKKNTVDFFRNKFFSFIAWGLRLTGNNNLLYLFDYIPDFTKINVNLKTIDDIQKFLGLSEKEVKFIENNFIQYTFKDKDIVESTIKRKTSTKKSKSI